MVQFEVVDGSDDHSLDLEVPLEHANSPT